MSISRIGSLIVVLAALIPAQAQTVTKVYDFGKNHGGPANPYFGGTLSQSPGGNLVSSAPGNDSSDPSQAYELPVTGSSLTVLQNFTEDLAYSGLTVGTDSLFHGTLNTGGASNLGTAYKISPTPNSPVTYQHDFTGGADGSAPVAAPIQSLAGDFYGTTSGQSETDTNDGTVYKITKAGVYSVLHAFSGADGSAPMGPLVQHTNGSFYGMTSAGGAHGQGTVFRINADGSFKSLYSFLGGASSSGPTGALIEGSDGNLYGLTPAGGSFGGTAFKITVGGTFTLVHTFTGGDGAFPYGGLVQATDGNFYGTTYAGGEGDWGTLFRITPAGVFTKLHDFDGSDAIEAVQTLLQHTNGKLYGQAYLGGDYDAGTVFQVDLGLAPFVTWLNVDGVVGAKVTILGQNFKSGTTTVSFNGVAASIVDLNPTYLKAIIPSGATTGYITVTTTKGTLTSNKPFIVH